MKIDEENFIIQLRKRNEKVLDYVIDNYGWIIKSIVKKYLYNLQSVQDECINDIFMGIWNNINTFDENKNDFKNWIAGIAKFKSIDYKRKYLKRLEYENIDDLNIAVSDSVYEILKDKLSLEVEEMLNCLDENDKELTLTPYAVKFPEESGKLSNDFKKVGEEFKISLID